MLLGVLLCVLSLSLLVFTCIILPTASFASSGKSMSIAYQNINYSLRGGSMRIACDQGLTHFKLSSGFGTRAKLYWKADEKWVELKDVIYSDTYFSFEGMGKEGGVAVSDLELNIGLPIFNDTNSKTANDYFYKAQRTAFTDYVYIIDVVNQTMRSSNLEPIVDDLVFDKLKYLQEQAYQTPGPIVAAKQAERQVVLQNTIQRYADGIRIVTTAGKHQLQSRCYLE